MPGQPPRTPRDLAAFIAREGIAAEIVPVELQTRTVQAAAAALGVAPAQIIKSLLFMVRDRPVLVIANGDSPVERRPLAERFGVGKKQIKLAEPAAVLALTGYEVGGVPPFGHLTRIPVLLDRAVLDWDVIYGGGGNDCTLLRVSPRELARATAAEWIDLQAGAAAAPGGEEMPAVLREIYGDAAGEQEARYRAALDAFSAACGPGPVLVFRAPGRVNLIGEHTDYNHGYVLPAALDKDILLLVRPRGDAVIRLRNLEPGYAPVTFTATQAIPPEPLGQWGNYARGAAQRLAQHWARDPAGFDGLADGAAPFGVPRGAGLSSSSALTVAVAVALVHLNAGPGAIDGMALARLCSEAEWYVGTRGGIMDQFIALLGRRDHALFLDCRPDAGGRYRAAPVALPAGYHILVVNSGVRHQNTSGGYNHRVAACRAGVALLRPHFGPMTHLRDVQETPWDRLEPHLPEEIAVHELAARGIDLGDIPGLDRDARLQVRARCRHVWTENRRVLEAVAAMRAGDAARLGALLDEAHASARDDYDISCPELELLVNAAREVEGVAGARLTGAGWGGCIVALVRHDAVAAFRDHVAARYLAATGRNAAIFDCRAGPGAGLVWDRR